MESQRLRIEFEMPWHQLQNGSVHQEFQQEYADFQATQDGLDPGQDVNDFQNLDTFQHGQLQEFLRFQIMEQMQFELESMLQGQMK